MLVRPQQPGARALGRFGVRVGPPLRTSRRRSAPSSAANVRWEYTLNVPLTRNLVAALSTTATNVSGTTWVRVRASARTGKSPATLVVATLAADSRPSDAVCVYNREGREGPVWRPYERRGARLRLAGRDGLVTGFPACRTDRRDVGPEASSKERVTAHRRSGRWGSPQGVLA
jgi:hypothetical protein